MNRVAVTLDLPENLVERAKSAGLLDSKRIEKWLMDELERESQIDAFFATLEKLRKIEPPLTEEEINEEIAADRREQLQLKLKNSQ